MLLKTGAEDYQIYIKRSSLDNIDLVRRGFRLEIGLDVPIPHLEATNTSFITLLEYIGELNP